MSQHTIRAILNKLIKIPLKIESEIYRLSSNKNLTEEIEKTIVDIPVSNGSRFYSKIQIKVGIIADSFIYNTFKDCCDLIYLTPDNWKEKIKDVEVVIILSVWHGLNNEWNLVYKDGSDSNYVLNIIKCYSKQKKIPIVFYSKEDPPNFNIFKELASDADVIFTSARECIKEYNKLYPKIPCFYLPFAVNPYLHNPIGMYINKIEKTVFFAGSWMKKYNERTNYQVKIFDWTKELGWNLVIADRNFRRNNRNYYYPIKFRKQLIHDFSYEELSKLYKIFPVILNLNSVSDNSTMFAMRVYDASACGCRIISNRCNEMEKYFSNVKVVETKQELEKVFSSSDLENNESCIEAVRNAFRRSVNYEIMAIILSKSGVKYPRIKNRSVAVVINRKSKKLIEYFHNQTYSEKYLFEGIDQISDISDYDMITFWNENYIYEPYYLEDMINGFKYTNSDYITRSYNEKGHRYSDIVFNKYLTVFWVKSFDKTELLNFPDGQFKLKNGYMI